MVIGTILINYFNLLIIQWQTINIYLNLTYTEVYKLSKLKTIISVIN